MLGLAGGALVLPALPGTAEQITLGSTVLGTCTFTAAPTVTAATNASVAGLATPTATTMNIGTPTDGTGIMQGWAFTMHLNASCNQIANLRLTSVSGGLKDPDHPPGAPPPGFLKRFDYGATVSFDGAPSAFLLPTNGTPGVTSIPNLDLTTVPYSGVAELHVTGLPDTSHPVMAGHYTDTLKVSLIPQ
jgi:hypothetical protein